MIFLLRLALHSKYASAAGQAPCSRRTRSNRETNPATHPMTIGLQSNRRHLTFRMRINRPPRHRWSVYLCQRHRLADRNDWRARPLQWSQHIAPMAKGGCSEDNRPRDGKIKAARCAAVGRLESGQRSKTWRNVLQSSKAFPFAQVFVHASRGTPRIQN